jgi:FkbM family methyltransferase
VRFLVSILVDFFAIALGRPSAGHRGARLRAHGKVIARFALWRRIVRRPVACERVAGYQVQVADYRTFFFLFSEIFAREEYFVRMPKPRPHIIDAGSNIGVAVLYFKMLYPQASIIAIEPSTSAAAILRHNVEVNRLTDVRVVQNALWEKAGTMELYTKPGEAAGVSSSLLAQSGYEPQRVDCITLSSLIDRTVDLLKIDVEGAELPVIRELCDSGKIGFVDRMIIEVHHDPTTVSDAFPLLLELLRTHGFNYSFAMGPTRFLMSLHEPQDLLLYTWRHGTSAGYR